MNDQITSVSTVVYHRALGFAATRGKLYYRHPELFKVKSWHCSIQRMNFLCIRRLVHGRDISTVYHVVYLKENVNNPVAPPGFYFTGSQDLQLLFLSCFWVLLVLYYLLFLSPITDHFQGGTGSLKNACYFSMCMRLLKVKINPV